VDGVTEQHLTRWGGEEFDSCPKRLEYYSVGGGGSESPTLCRGNEIQHNSGGQWFLKDSSVYSAFSKYSAERFNFYVLIVQLLACI
jgi:hypothetical protein